MCFVDLEKAFDSVTLGVLWGVHQEYGILGLLPWATQSLYERGKSLVNIAGSKLDLFPETTGLLQDCPLSLILYITFMDRVSRRSQAVEGFWFGDLRTASAFCR